MLAVLVLYTFVWMNGVYHTNMLLHVREVLSVHLINLQNYRTDGNKILYWGISTKRFQI